MNQHRGDFDLGHAPTSFVVTGCLRTTFPKPNEVFLACSIPTRKALQPTNKQMINVAGQHVPFTHDNRLFENLCDLLLFLVIYMENIFK